MAVGGMMQKARRRTLECCRNLLYRTKGKLGRSLFVQYPRGDRIVTAGCLYINRPVEAALWAAVSQ